MKGILKTCCHQFLTFFTFAKNSCKVIIFYELGHAFLLVGLLKCPSSAHFLIRTNDLTNTLAVIPRVGKESVIQVRYTKSPPIHIILFVLGPVNSANGSGLRGDEAVHFPHTASGTRFSGRLIFIAKRPILHNELQLSFLLITLIFS